MKHQNLEIKYKPVADLIPYVNNARTHSDDQVTQIAASIKEFGFTNPILLDGDNGVIAGHGRLMAAKKLGMDTVPCIELSGLSETQKKAYILADNRLAEKSGWDEDIVKVEFEALKADGFDIDSVGLDFEELFPDINSDDGVDTTDEPDTPEPPVVPKTRPGDIWTMGGASTHVR